MESIRSILLVDDDQDDQFVFAECLSGISKEIILQTANDGIDALEKLKAAEHKPDLIFIDLNMPRMNGKALLRELKSTATLSQVPVIVYSTSSSPEDLRDTKSLGAQQ
ncbi:MAG TPA: response regulator, partial [Chitinophagaceae bacterium]